MGEELFPEHGVAPDHVGEQLACLPAERANDADPGERLADAAVNQSPRPCAPIGRSAGSVARTRS